MFILLILLVHAQNGFGDIDSLKLELDKTSSGKEKVSLFLAIGDGYESRDSAFHYWNKAVDLAQKVKWYSGEAQAYRAMAWNYDYLYKTDSALIYWDLSRAAYLKEFEQNPSSKTELDVAIVDYNIAIDVYLGERYIEATKQLQIALKVFLKHKDNIGINDCYNILGDIYYQQEDYERALKHFEEAIVYANEINDSVRLKVSYNNKATILLETEKYAESLVYFNKSLDYLEKGNLWGLHEIKMNIARIFTAQEKYTEAESILKAGTQYFKESNNIRDEIISQNYTIYLFAQQKQWKKIVPIAKDNLNLLNQYTFLGQKKETYKYLSMAYENLNQKDLSLAYYKQFAAVRDSLFNEDKNKQIERLNIQLEVTKKEQEIGKLTEANLLQEIQITRDKNIRNGLMAFVGFLMMLFVALFINYKRRQDKKRHKLALMKVEIEQRMLRSQMNPHFIFNALNSIQSYIATNDTYQAEVFLSKFSTLIRNILELSLNEYISFDKEIETLRLYMELEKLRFDDRFEFEIEDQLTDSAYKIPPMLIQPFVENAIIHGMKGKADTGMIKVRFEELDEDLILCTVEDNGVGRQTTHDNGNGHQSLATKLIDDRMQFFNQGYDQQFDIKIIDKKDVAGSAAGTQVELRIPMV